MSAGKDRLSVSCLVVGTQLDAKGTIRSDKGSSGMRLTR